MDEATEKEMLRLMREALAEINRVSFLTKKVLEHQMGLLTDPASAKSLHEFYLDSLQPPSLERPDDKFLGRLPY